MGRHRFRLGWVYDAEREEFTTPSGQKMALLDMVRRMQDDIEGRHDLTGQWAGWSIRQQYLRGPGGVRLTPSTCRQFWRWVESPEGLICQPSTTRYGTPRLDALRVGGTGYINHRAANTHLRGRQGT